MTQAELKATHDRLMGKAENQWNWTYRGPDQQEHKFLIVLGMACPMCHGPVHDPNQRPAEGSIGRPIHSTRFECMSETCPLGRITENDYSEVTRWRPKTKR